MYSKGYFRRWFPEQIKRKKELHLLMIDLWKLKQVNKLYGVTTGDELLIQIAEYLHKINEANHVFMQIFIISPPSILVKPIRTGGAAADCGERPHY